MPAHNPNRLAQETSPYLLQHADNPVDWRPWGEEAFSEAREKDKPILLSIGYSACHWCHVMAHESFEDEETAQLMNRLFVNVKLDREERPDVDKIYQASQSLLTQRTGGWPLTMFLDPQDLCPFFGGTYFPKEPRHNLPPFKEVLKRVHAHYVENRADVGRQNRALKEALERVYAPDEVPDQASDRASNRPSPALIETARADILRRFDPVHGGFGDEPKFPHPELIRFMLRRADPRARHAALYTLEKMCLGGLYDQLGGGFYRYSVDAAWQIPHFEKMLYDNGPLLGLLAETWHASGDRRFLDAARATARWVLREMQSPEGGYYATLDADSEGGEGAFYAWERDEAAAALTAGGVAQGDVAVVLHHFGLDKVPNFEGKWHLHVAHADEGSRADIGPDDAPRAVIGRAAQILFAHRAKRPRPGRDEKILTSWNGLMIGGMARAAQLIGDDDCPDCLDSATRALDFVRRNLWRNGRLSASCKDGRVRFDGYLDDYAFVLDAIFELLQCRWRDEDFAFALELADAVLKHFEDAERGGYYFTAHDHERLLQRPRSLYDEATPSGYGVAALALARFGLLCGRGAWINSADRALAQAAATMAGAPSGCVTLLDTLARDRHRSHRQRRAGRRARTLAARRCRVRFAVALLLRDSGRRGAAAVGVGGQTRARRCDRLPVPRHELPRADRRPRRVHGAACGSRGRGGRKALSALRVAVRLVLIGAHVVVGVLLCIFALPSDWNRASPARLERGRGIVRWWLNVCMRIIGIRLRVEGAPIAVASLVVANHVSWMDIVIIGALQPVSFLAKVEIAGWPVIGYLARKAGTVFIARGEGAEAAARLIGRRLATGTSVAFFPEGTTSDGADIRKFHPRLFMTAIESRVPVQPLCLAYPHPGGGIHWKAPYTRTMSFVAHALAIMAEPCIHAVARYTESLDARLGDGDRRQLAERARELMLAEHQRILL